MAEPVAARRRFNPLLEEWVLCSPQRINRPWQGHVDAAPTPLPPPYDPTCYLCPGNERANGARNPDYRHTFVFDNDFPPLELEGGGTKDHRDGLLVSHAESGVSRVVCFSPRHDLSLARMDATGVREVVDTWADQWRSLAGQPDIGHVQVFENRGQLMGASNPHPHSQIWATAHVPTIPARKLATQRAHYALHGRDLLGDYLDQEMRGGERVVFETEHWVALVPFWALWPFETMLLPRRPVADLHALDGAERTGLAAALRRLTGRYDRLFDVEFPYSMGIACAPTDGHSHPEWRLHVVFLPPLLRSATIRKFVAGYELVAEPQRDLTAEDAAARLRSIPDANAQGR
jgi:UDPglucose--hexose-1-phosphate uridylyltransferase